VVAITVLPALFDAIIRESAHRGPTTAEAGQDTTQSKAAEGTSLLAITCWDELLTTSRDASVLTLMGPLTSALARACTTGDGVGEEGEGAVPVLAAEALGRLLRYLHHCDTLGKYADNTKNTHTHTHTQAHKYTPKRGCTYT
jgi:hypothetical protein